MTRAHTPHRVLRIAMFSSGLPVAGQKRGGVDRIAHDLADGLARRGHAVTVWSFDPQPQDAAYDVRPLPGRRFANARGGRSLTSGYLGNLLALAPGYRDVDAIVAMGDSLFLPLAGKPLVRVMHGSALGEALSSRTPWRFVHQLGVYVQELVTGITQPGCVGVSESTRRYNPFVRRVIPNGVDTSVFRHEPVGKTREPSILFVGSLDGRKRGNLLLEWFERDVRSRLPTATLAMVSQSGPRAPGVTYHTGIDTEELAAMYRRAWVYATPSTYEGFGLPYLEAMASGTPVIATPNPGSREVLDGGRFGLLVEDAEFGRTLANLLEDADTRHNLARVGIERAQALSASVMVRRYEQLLYELCGSRLPVVDDFECLSP